MRVKPGQPQTAENRFRWDRDWLSPPHSVHSPSPSSIPRPLGSQKTFAEVDLQESYWVYCEVEEGGKKGGGRRGGRGSQFYNGKRKERK
jgi:hypothetical protein